MLQKLVALKFLAVAFVCLAQVVQKGGSCPSNWIWQPSNPSVCYYISTERLGFHAADKSCKDKSSSLASNLSSDEHTFISGELLVFRRGWKAKEDFVNFWIGLRTLKSGSSWTHVDGSQISPATSFWEKGYPSGKGKCGLMHVKDSDQEVIAYWRDENCDEPRAYICKQAPGSSPAPAIFANLSTVTIGLKALPTQPSAVLATKASERAANSTTDRSEAVKSCSVGFTFMPDSNSCYLILPDPMNWAKASVACQSISRKTHLAFIRNAADNFTATIYLEKELRGTKTVCPALKTLGVWIGAQRKDVRRCDVPFVWKTSEGLDIGVNFTDWGVGQPDCINGESCVQIKTGSWLKPMWNDMHCDRPMCALCQEIL